MGTGKSPRVGDVNPDEAWGILNNDSTARLIDVRTREEWNFVGVPELGDLGQRPIFVEWSSLPHMSPNPHFAAEIESALGLDSPGPLLFLCRSGARSLSAAHVVVEQFAARGVDVNCLNVAEGFEGDLDASGHRGSTNGWKVRGLAWRQS